MGTCICRPINDFETEYNRHCTVHNPDRNGLSLSFRYFSEVNAQRHEDWPKAEGQIEQWSLSDWGCAVAEEAGEVCGAIKRYNRIRLGQVVKGGTQRVFTEEDALHLLHKEIGDTMTYLDILARESGSTLEECIRLAFNGVSEREGFPHRV